MKLVRSQDSGHVERTNMASVVGGSWGCWSGGVLVDGMVGSTEGRDLRTGSLMVGLRSDMMRPLREDLVHGCWLPGMVGMMRSAAILATRSVS